MKTFFEELFAYGFHCNQQLASIFERESATIDTKSATLFSHILNAHQIWNNRILGRPMGCTVWETRPETEFAEIDRNNYEVTLTVLDTIDLGNEIAYKTSGGQPFTNSVHDLLFHIVNHSTYHRGQLALLFRQNGIEPLATDYIFYKR